MEIGLFESEPPPRAGATVYRALRDDAAVRWVVIAPGDTYEVAHADGDSDIAGGVVLVEPYDVPEAEDGAFLAAWHEAHAELTGRRGYLGARLYRAVRAVEPRWIEIARWSSPLMVSRALGEGAVLPTLYLATGE